MPFFTSCRITSHHRDFNFAGVPKAAHGIFDQLNWKMELSGKEERFSLADAEWGRLPDGHVVGKPTPLFPRIES